MQTVNVVWTHRCSCNGCAHGVCSSVVSVHRQAIQMLYSRIQLNATNCSVALLVMHVGTPHWSRCVHATTFHHADLCVQAVMWSLSANSLNSLDAMLVHAVYMHTYIYIYTQNST